MMTEIYKHCVKDWPNKGDITCYPWSKWGRITNNPASKLRGRRDLNRSGKTNYTDRQIAGLDLLPKAAKVLDRKKSKQPELPPGAQVCIDSMFYKIGLHGLPFMLIDGEWVRSGKEVHEIRALM